MKDFLGFLLMIPVLTLFQFLLFKICDLLKLKRLALYFLAVADAPLFGMNAKKIRDYCVNNCPDKNNCKKCTYWTCENYCKGLEKE